MLRGGKCVDRKEGAIKVGGGWAHFKLIDGRLENGVVLREMCRERGGFKGIGRWAGVSMRKELENKKEDS